MPQVEVTDSLGAGDIFHGAFSHALARGDGLLDEYGFAWALGFAADVAAHSCRTFGTRAWMRSWPPGGVS